MRTPPHLRSLPVPDFVLPGHLCAESEPQSPWLTQSRWTEIPDAGIRDMETLLAHYKTDGEDYLDGWPKEILPSLYGLGDFEGSALYGLFVFSEFFLVNAVSFRQGCLNPFG